MQFVLDASITMTWCFEDETSPFGEAILDKLTRDRAVVPSIWRLEVSNVLLVAERRGRLTEFQAGHFLSLLEKLPIQVDDGPRNAAAVLAAGRRHGLSAYDAAYLVLAVERGIGVATEDDRLRKAVLKAGIPVVLN